MLFYFFKYIGESRVAPTTHDFEITVLSGMMNQHFFLLELPQSVLFEIWTQTLPAEITYTPVF